MQSLVDTKKEYTEFLCDSISSAVSERIYNMYLECYKKGPKCLQQFQKELEKIPHWNNHIIEREAANILEKSNCSYLYKVLKLTIMTSVKIKFFEYGHRVKNIKVKMPTFEDFIHKCFINAAIFSWKHSYLYSQTNLTSVQIQNNINLIESNTRKTICKALRQCINVKEIIDDLEEIMQKSMRSKSRSKKQKEISHQYSADDDGAESSTTSNDTDTKSISNENNEQQDEEANYHQENTDDNNSDNDVEDIAREDVEEDNQEDGEDREYQEDGENEENDENGDNEVEKEDDDDKESEGDEEYIAQDDEEDDEEVRKDEEEQYSEVDIDNLEQEKVENDDVTDAEETEESIENNSYSKTAFESDNDSSSSEEIASVKVVRIEEPPQIINKKRPVFF